MNTRKAISTADSIRPNTIDDQLKASWLWEMEADVAELMDVELPECTFPEDQELLMPFPHDSFYHLYLCAMIDSVLEDTQLYINDMTMANNAKEDSFRWWRRHHMKKCNQYIRAFPWQPEVKGEEDEATRTPDTDSEETVSDLPTTGA